MEKIPSKDRPEWRKIVTGELHFEFQSFALQMKINQIKRFIEFGSISVDDGVDELYRLCKKYSVATGNDIKKVFSTNKTI